MKKKFKNSRKRLLKKIVKGDRRAAVRLRAIVEKRMAKRSRLAKKGEPQPVSPGIPIPETNVNDFNTASEWEDFVINAN